MSEYRVTVVLRGFVNVHSFDTVEEALDLADASIIKGEPCFVSVYGPKGRVFSYELPIQKVYNA